MTILTPKQQVVRVLCEEAEVPMIVILLAPWWYVNRVTDWCVTGRGFTPRRVQL